MPRRFTVSRTESGQTLAHMVRSHMQLSWSAARRLVQQGRIRINGTPCSDPSRRLVFRQRIDVEEPTPAQPRPSASTSPLSPRIIRYLDDQVVVVDKPAGITTMRHPEEAAEFGKRARRFLPPTLADLLLPLLPRSPGGKPPRLHAVHRLDKDTTGLVVFALSPGAERHLGRQFREHTLERRYLALCRGEVVSGRIESFLVRDRGDGRRGSGSAPGEGQRAVTHVRVLEQLGTFTLVECRLETGRTHQVRIHLGEAGTPLCGERVYDRPLHGRPYPDPSGARRVMLHAALLGFDHPATGKRVTWEAPLPHDMAALLKRIRHKP